MAYNYDQPSLSTELTGTGDFTIVPAPTIYQRKLQSLLVINQADDEQLKFELWLDDGGDRTLICRERINPGDRFNLPDPQQYLLTTTQSLVINLVEAATERFLSVSAVWQDKWEYHVIPELIDYWTAGEGEQTVQASDGTRLERWTGQFAGLTFDNLLLPDQQPKVYSSGGLNDRPYIEFKAARNDFLAMVFGSVKAQPLTIAMVAEFAGADGDFVFDAVDNTDRVSYRQTAGQMELDAYAGAPTPQLHGTDAAFKLSNVHVVVVDGASSKVYWEGGANLIGATPGDKGMAGITLGGDYQQTAANASDLNIYEVAVFQGAQLSNAILDRWGREFGAKHNRPWTAVS